MLIALSTLLEIITPYEDVPSLRILMGGIATDRLISIVFGALLAWAAHSSVAVALLGMSFAEKGVVPLIAALALISGAYIGTALYPLLEGARGRRCGGTKGCSRKPHHLSCRPPLGCDAASFILIGFHVVQIEPKLLRPTSSNT